MNYKVVEYSDKVAGSCLQGYVEASYAQLRELFGPSNETDGYKVSTEWIIRFDDGAVATIYDYKMTNLYDREYPGVSAFRHMPSYNWHIGGHSKTIVQRVRDVINA